MVQFIEKSKKKSIWVVVSGGFDPIHIGHIRMFQSARKLGDRLTVILNTDEFLVKKKGYYFMPFKDRAEIIQAFDCVTDIVRCMDKDMSVSQTLAYLRPNVFANGGDRLADNVPEVKICENLGIKMVFNVGGTKVKSSSKLVEQLQVYAPRKGRQKSSV